MSLVRDGKTKTVNITVEEQPQDFSTASIAPVPAARPENDTIDLDRIGLKVTDLTPDLAERLGYRETPEGALVTRVDPNGMAAGKGLGSGMIISKVDGKAIKTAADVRKALESSSLEKGRLPQVLTPQGLNLILPQGRANG